MRRHFLIAFVALTALPPARAQVVAPEPLLIPTSLPSLEFGTLDLGDYDADGDLDLLVTGRSGESQFTRLYRAEDSLFTVQIGSNTIPLSFKVYRDVQIIMDDVWQGATDWGDYDADGDLDILLSGITEIDLNTDERVRVPVTKVFRNQEGVFAQDFSIVLPDVYNGIVEWIDFDLDGDLDIFASGASTLTSPFSPVNRLLKNVNGSFVEVTSSGIPAVMFGAADWSDFDHDGDLDVFITGVSDSGDISAIYSNMGDGRFERAPFDFPRLSFGSVDWGDYDGDGYEDLLLTGGALDPGLLRGSTMIFHNDNGTGFSKLNQTLPAVALGNGSWLDYDVDGTLDFVVSGMKTPFSEATGWVYVNDGIRFQPEMNLGGLAFSALVVGDYNADGDPEIINMGVTAQGKAFLNFYLNRIFPEILPPGLITR